MDDVVNEINDSIELNPQNENFWRSFSQTYYDFLGTVRTEVRDNPRDNRTRVGQFFLNRVNQVLNRMADQIETYNEREPDEWDPQATGFTLEEIDRFDRNTTDPMEKEAIRGKISYLRRERVHNEGANNLFNTYRNTLDDGRNTMNFLTNLYRRRRARPSATNEPSGKKRRKD